MPTVNQLRNKPRTPQHRKSKSPALRGGPFAKGVVVEGRVMEPKKPNSAKRKVVRVRLLKSKRLITAFVPGEGHRLQEHSIVLLRGGGVPDLPGIKYRVVRGVDDDRGVDDRRQARSRYGRKKPK